MTERVHKRGKAGGKKQTNVNVTLENNTMSIDNFLSSLQVGDALTFNGFGFNRMQRYSQTFRNIDHVRQIQATQRLCSTIFQWENLPPELDTELIENQFWDNDLLGWYYDDVVKKHLVLPVTITEHSKIYATIPKRVDVKGVNYVKYNLIPDEDIILIQSSTTGNNFQNMTLSGVDTLNDINQTLINNLAHLKQPYLFTGAPEQIDIVKKMLNQINSNALAIDVPDGIDLDNQLQILQTGAENYTTELADLYNIILQRMLTELGVDNLNIDKKERTNLDEVNANNQIINLYRDSLLIPRLRAIKKINAKFGLNVNLKYYKIEENELTGGDNNDNGDT
jgi:hypothetical protein